MTGQMNDGRNRDDTDDQPPEAQPESPFGLDFGSLLSMAQTMQQGLVAQQQALAEQVVEGASGGGAVRIRVSGDHRFESVSINPAAVDTDDITLLEDLVLAALHDATLRLADARDTAAGGGLGGLGLSGLGDLGLAGMGLGDLGPGALGLGGPDGADPADDGDDPADDGDDPDDDGDDPADDGDDPADDGDADPHG